MELTKAQKADIFDSLFQEYVIEHGLGGMSKTDFDALLLWLVSSRQKGLGSFELSNLFKIKESRVKSLLELAAVKFDQMDRHEAWQEILSLLKDVEYDIESLEKGQIRFQLKNPMLFRWLQEHVRNLNSTVSYYRSSEQVTMNLDILYRILDNLWEPGTLGEKWKGRVHEEAKKNIQAAIGRIGEKIAGNTLEELREMKRPKLLRILQQGAALSGIGNFIVPLLEKINS